MEKAPGLGPGPKKRVPTAPYIRLLKLTIILTYTDRIVEYIEDESGKEQGEDDVKAPVSLSHSPINGVDHTKKRCT